MLFPWLHQVEKDSISDLNLFRLVFSLFSHFYPHQSCLIILYSIDNLPVDYLQMFIFSKTHQSFPDSLQTVCFPIVQDALSSLILPHVDSTLNYIIVQVSGCDESSGKSFRNICFLYYGKFIVQQMALPHDIASHLFI